MTATLLRFRIALVIILGATFAWLHFAQRGAEPTEVGGADGDRLQVFYSPDCPHCHEAIEFLKKRPEIAYVLHDVSKPRGEALFRRAVERLHIEDPGVPLFVHGSRRLVGFDAAETTGRELLALWAGVGADAGEAARSSPIVLPIFGEVDPTHHSLLTLTVVLGLADGFNPCAMWVLVYLISLIVEIRDRRKIWWIVGTFVLASGILYFLFMTAWLNTFLLIGYIRPLTRIVALLAIGFGLDHLFRLAADRGEVACEVGDIEQRRRTMQWGRDIVAAPMGLASLTMVIALAFTVNAIEFVCSAALPAIYTHVLSLTSLPAALHYAYLALYVFFFMLDDLIIFGLAAFAVQKIVDSRYAAVSRGVGGVILVGLGGWMLAR